MRSYDLLLRVLALLMLLFVPDFGWGEHLAELRTSGVALTKDELVSDGKVTCGLIEGDWRPGQLSKKGLFFSHSRRAELLIKRAAGLNRIRLRTAFQDALLLRLWVKARKLRRLTTRHRATCRFLGNLLTPTLAPAVGTGTLSPGKTVLPTAIALTTETAHPANPISTAYPTHTLYPTNTPFDTYTPFPTFTPVNTATVYPTNTPYPTYTAIPTLTPTQTSTPTISLPIINSSPLISGISGSTMEITGTGFSNGALVSIGSTPCNSTIVNSPSSISCVVPSLGASPLRLGITVQNSDGGVNTRSRIFFYAGNPSLWLKADSITNTSNNVEISSWPDSSGNNNHAVPVAAGRAPRYISSGTNNSPIVRFGVNDGVEDCLMISDSPSLRPSTLTIVTSVTETASDGNGKIIAKAYRNDGTWNSPWSSYELSTSGVGGAVTVSGSLRNIGHNLAGNMHIPYYMRYDGSKFQLYLQSYNLSGAVDYNGNVASYVGVGCQGPTLGDFFRGDIGDLLFYGTALSDSDILVVTNYLLDKY